MSNLDPMFYDESYHSRADKAIKAANWLCIVLGLAAGVYLLSGRVWR